MFIEKAVSKHGNKYDYSLIDYKNNKTNIIIVCKNHGEFIQRPSHHLSGTGCPSCNESKGEREIAYLLDKNNINYKRQHTFEGCKNKKLLPFDFFIPLLNICIEYDGRQHFEAIDVFGGEEALRYIQHNDEIKTDYCKENNIKLIRIRYDEVVYADEMIKIWNSAK